LNHVLFFPSFVHFDKYSEHKIKYSAKKDAEIGSFEPIFLHLIISALQNTTFRLVKRNIFPRSVLPNGTKQGVKNLQRG
jgi:hypothetical protein